MRNKNLEAVLLLLNDNIADGRDVSWIWDCNLEILAKTKAKIYVGGSRCWDLAVRLKYAGVPIQEVFTDLENSLQKLTKVHKKVFVLPTYTSMLEFRALLGKVTNVKKMWKLNQ